MTEIFLVSFLVLASFYLGSWAQNYKLRKLIKQAALYKITDHYGVTTEVEEKAIGLVAQRQMYPKGRGSFHNAK